MDTPAPLWLWRAACLALGTVLVIWIGGMLVVSAGATDPLPFGSLQWQTIPPPANVLSPGSGQNWPVSQIVPPPPFTLEVSARFDPTSDVLARWGIILSSEDDYLEIYIGNGNNYQLFSIDSRRIDFPPLRRAGQTNVLTFSVDNNENAILRLNNEVAWQGVYQLGKQSARLGLSSVGGWSNEARLTWETIRLYTPTLNNSR